MRYWTGGAFAFFLALFQAASVEQFKILGVTPNLMLVLVVSNCSVIPCVPATRACSARRN